MARATHSDLARRVNAAWALLKKRGPIMDAARALARRHGISEVQAYRYIGRAREAKRVLPIPERKEVFTVKLPIGLIRRLRRFGRSTGETLSAMVTRALEALLKREGHG